MSNGFKSNKAAVKSKFDQNKVRCLNAIGLKQNELVVIEITNMKAVDTGRMRASNSYRVGEDVVIVGNTANYAIFVNCGTRRASRRPFMENSILNYRHVYKRIFEEYLGEGF